MSFIASNEYNGFYNRDCMEIIFANHEKQAVFCRVTEKIHYRGMICDKLSNFDADCREIMLASTKDYNNPTITRMFLAAAVLAHDDYIILNDMFVLGFLMRYFKHYATEVTRTGDFKRDIDLNAYVEWLDNKIPNHDSISDAMWLQCFVSLSALRRGF